TCAVSEEGIVRLDDAELVALGVGEHDMLVVGALTDIDVAGPELDQPLDRFPLVIDGRARQIEMDAVLARLVLRDRLELDPESGVIRGHEADLIRGLVVDLPVQGVGPEARETERIVRIDAESDEPRSRLARHHPTCRVTPSDGASSRSNSTFRSYMGCATPISRAALSAGISPWRSTPESPSPTPNATSSTTHATGGRGPP